MVYREAFGNKLAGSLSALYPEGGKTTYFLGYQMNNLFDFFMLFVAMGGVAALLLFLLTRKLQKICNDACLKKSTFVKGDV